MTVTDRSKLNRALNAFVGTITWPAKRASPNRSITYDDFLVDRMLMIAAIRTGIPFALFEMIQSMSPFSEQDWAEILQLSTKSLQRYKQEEGYRFKPLQSEKIIEMAEVTQIGLEFFGDMERFRLWLNTPNYAMGHIKPIELLRDSYGKELVVAALTRAGHGIFV
jgi:putative toxin-antitoxin system antitoxin component (TIGR02293 family)